VSELPSSVHGGGSQFNAYPIGNLRLTLFPTQTFLLPSAVGTPQEEDQLLTVRGLGVVDILVDGLVADGPPGVIEADPTGDDLRRPMLLELGHDIGADAFLFEPDSLTDLLSPAIRPLLGPMRQVAVVGRGSVQAQLPGNRALGTPQRSGNLLRAFLFPLHFKNSLSFVQA